MSPTRPIQVQQLETGMADIKQTQCKSGIEKILDQLISDDPEQYGLIRLPGPTGTGKTYATINHIADELMAHGPECRRYVFVTNVKRNLPYKPLIQILEERGHPELTDLVINLDSNVDMLRNNLASAKKMMAKTPYKYLRRETGSSKAGKPVKAQFDILSLPEFQDAERLCKELEKARALSGKEYSSVKRVAVTSAQEGLERAERELRRAIASVFNSMCSHKQNAPLMSIEEKRALVENDSWWKWLTVLYPSVLTFKKRVLFMSVNKLLVKNSPIIEPSEAIWESNLLKVSVVFIDELELSKNVINTFIIKESVGKATDAVSLFLTLLEPALSGHSLTDRLFYSPSTDRSAGSKLRDEYKKIVKAAEDVYTTLHMNQQFCLSDELRYKNQPFLFNDCQSHIISTSSDMNPGSGITVHFLESQNQIKLEPSTPPPVTGTPGADTPQTDDVYSVPLLLSRLEGIINWTIGWMVRVAENYMRVVAEDAAGGRRPEISFDQAVGTILSEFNILDEAPGNHNPTRDRIIAMAHDERARRITKVENVSNSPTNLCLHQTGFRVYAFRESPQHDTMTRMRRCQVPHTAEQKLVELCNRNLVVGISASLEIPSVLGNYDLDYVDGMLQEHSIRLTPGQMELIEADYQQSINHYDKIRIRVNKVLDADESGQYSEACWQAVFDDEESARCMFNDVALSLSGLDDSYFYQKRILKICTVFKDFWKADDARAMLCVLNALPREGGSKLDSLKLREWFGKILSSLKKDIEVKDACFILGGSSDVFERNKKKALERLANNEKVFIITTYQSAGAGQNLQYEIPEGVNPIKINDRPGSEEMDFDCLYLEKPTHTSPVINQGSRMDMAEALRHILGCEYLYENDEITQGGLLKSIRMALCALSGTGSDNSHALTESARLSGVKQVYQAVGRLGRTNMKMPVIRLFVDEHLMEGVPIHVLESCGLIFTPEFSKIVEAFDGQAAKPSGEKKRLERQAEKASRRSRTLVNSLLRSGWGDKDRRTWIELGEQVLKFPTLPPGCGGLPFMERNYYVELGEERLSYWYMQEDDFREVQVFLGRTSTPGHSEVSEKSARLDQLMNIPGVEAYFKEQGYATEWIASTRIVTPIIFQNIYKGRLGEVCGRFILQSNGIDVQEIDDAARFEKFDFVLPGIDGTREVYIDFKHWRKGSDKTGWEAEQLLEWVFTKMEVIGAERAVIANILPPDNGIYEVTHHSKDNRELLIVPALVKRDCSFNEEAIQEIRKFANGLDN